MTDVLGEAATPALLKAWAEAYWFLAEVLQRREVEIRDGIKREEGGWRGWRQLVVTDKIRESSVITSFTLRPTDGRAVLRHKPGQYLTLRFGGAEARAMKRNYSISCGPNGDHYRISVKREVEGAGGSRFLHDHLQVGDVIESTPPAGEFFLPDAPRRPIVLLSGGVGLTPMVSMLETIADRHPDLETYYVHGALNSATHAMDRQVKALAARHGRISVTNFYSAPLDGDALGKTHDVAGYITPEWLRDNTPLRSADIYLCGPRPFLSALVNGLLAAGVPEDRVHYELFGPTEELLAA
jgi:nitric oxide dioxygenase